MGVEGVSEQSNTGVRTFKVRAKKKCKQIAVYSEIGSGFSVTVCFSCKIL